jgi:hypothetical protein
MTDGLLSVHVAAGGLAIVLGAVALAAKKGRTIHRRAGLVFVGAMLVMGGTASLLGLRHSLSDPNVGTGLLTAYFVITSLMTVRPESPWTRRITVAALVVAVLLAVGSVAGGIDKVTTGGLAPGGVPRRTIGVMSFILAAMLLLASIGDVRVLRSGSLRGAPRLKRHLWRMCFALFIAAGSFFSIRERVARILPEPFTSGPMRLLPIVLLFAVMFYWLWKLRRRGEILIAE